MLNNLKNTERAARDAFLSDDYYDGASSKPGDGILGSVNTLWFFMVAFSACSIAIACIFMLA
jgi:hypothetical protein